MRERAAPGGRGARGCHPGQFLIEALTISLAGGLIGLLLGVLIAWAVNLSGLINAASRVRAAALAVGLAMAVGLFCGIAPARRDR